MFSDDAMRFQVDERHHQFFAVKGTDAGTVEDLFFSLFVNNKKWHRLWVSPVVYCWEVITSPVNGVLFMETGYRVSVVRRKGDVYNLSSKRVSHIFVPP